MPTQTETIMGRIRDLWKQVPGVATVSPTTPRELTRFPSVVLNAGAAVYSKPDRVTTRVNRDISMLLVLKEATAGLQMESEAAGVMWLDRVYDYFSARHLLQLPTDTGVVDSAQITRDTGVQVLDFDGQRYVGVIFTLNITYMKETETI